MHHEVAGAGLRVAARRSMAAQFVPAVAIFVLLVAGAAAQNPPSTSLADAARQARAAQKQAQPAAEGNHAQQIADELSEDQNEKDAPAGFKTYNAGAYKLWVPAPYAVNGHDDGGIVLAGPAIGKTTPLVLAGNTVVLHGGDSDDAFRDAATQFVRGYLQSANCSKTTVANHNGYQCMLAEAHLQDHVVSGGAVFVRSANNMFPVFCLSTTSSNAREMVNNPRVSYSYKLNARTEMLQEEEYARQVWKKCETVFESIRLPDEAGTEVSTKAPAGGAAAPQKPAEAAGASTAAKTSAASSVKQAGSPEQAPPAATAGAAAQPAPAPATASEVLTAAPSSVPPGLKAHHFNYCQGPGQCWDGSVLVPAQAQLINSDCKQYVFEMKVQGQSFFLLAGPTAGDGCGQRSAMDPNLVRWQQLAAPENMRAPGTSNTISEQQATLDGKRGFIIKIKFRKGLAEWIGKRAEIQSNGIPLVVGCMAPAESFADGEDICSALIESLRLP